MDAAGELAVGAQLAVDRELFVVGHVADVGDAVSANHRERSAGLLESALVRKVAGDMFGQECPDAGTAQDPRGSAGTVAQELDAVGLRVVGVAPDRGERRAVGGELGAVELLDEHGVAPGEVFNLAHVGRESIPALAAGGPGRPRVVGAPVAAEAPLAVGEPAHDLPDALDQLALGRDPHDVELQEPGRGPEVDVTVVEPRHGEPAVQIDHTGLGAAVSERCVVGADRDEPTSAERHRRPDGAVINDEVRRLRTRRTADQQPRHEWSESSDQATKPLAHGDLLMPS